MSESSTPGWRQWNRRPTAVHARRSIRAKLMRVIMSTTALALCCAGAAMLSHDLSAYRHTWANDMAIEASVLAISSVPELLSGNKAAAYRDLASLRARSRVLAAGIYSADKTLFAEYSRTGEVKAPPVVPDLPRVRVSGERIELIQRVVQDGKWIGTIYLRTQYDLIGRAEAYIGIFALVTLLSLGVAYIFSRRLQAVITEPLDAVTTVARQIVDERDYSLRAKKTTDDEFGLVLDAFNSMLDEVQSQTLALERSNAALQEEVHVRQAAEAALNVATARLESTMAAGEIGSWLWDIRRNHFTADRNLAALYGLDDEAKLSGHPARHHQHIHPEDLGAVQAAEAEALKTGVFASTEFRVTLPNGTERWMARRGKVQLDGEGNAIFIAGLLIDISPQKKAEQALRESERLYRAIGESIDYGVWVCAPDGINIYTSESYLRLIGMTQQEHSKRGWVDSLHPDDVESTRAAWNECVSSGGVWYRELRVRGADGVYHPVLAQGVPVRAENGEIGGWAGISLDIERLKQTEAALREADRRKDEFLATLAHELRNPLAPIRHAVKLLDSAIDPHRQQWALDVIARQVQRMALLLDDLLDVSRITRGSLDLKIEAVSLASLVGTAVETVRPLMDEKRQHLAIRVPDHPVTLAVDPLRLSQSLSNLLTNAVKYTDSDGRIDLCVVISPAAITMSVTDTGIGIEAQAISGLFEMFSQVDAAIDRAQGGLGIGLALVKGLISLHGGTVEATSAGMGQGSQFTISLPANLVVPSPAEKAVVPPPSPAVRTRKTLLVADDNIDAAQSMAMVLEIGGYNVHVAHTGQDALQLARDTSPDAAILDIGMPDMTGYDLARLLKSEHSSRPLVLIAITGWGQEDDKERAKAAGFDRHLTKPVDPDEVEAVLHSLLKRAEG